MEIKNSAIILRVSDFGEADRLVTFFTEDHGKVKGVAKHAKKSKKRFGAGLEPGTIGAIRYAEKNNVELVRIDEFSVELPVWRIASSLDRMFALSVTLELAEKMLPLSHASKERYGLLARWVNFLAENDPTKAHVHAYYYKWLVASGIGPVFDKCTVCGKIESGGWFLEGAHGGTVCANCHRPGRENIQLSEKMIKYLSEFKLGKIPIGNMNEADRVFSHLIGFALGGNLKSLEVLETI